MPTDQEQLERAKALIKAKQYIQARALLETIDHPTAAKWLAKLDEMSPSSSPKPTSKKIAQPRTKSSTSKGNGVQTKPLLIAAGIGLILVAIVFVVVAFSGGDNLDGPFNGMGVSVKYPRAWVRKDSNASVIFASQPQLTSSTPDTLQPGQAVITVYVTRETGVDFDALVQTQEIHALLGSEDWGIELNRGPISTEQIGPYTVHYFSADNPGIHNAYFSFSSDGSNAASFSIISSPSEMSYIDDLARTMISSYTFTPSLAGDFACPARAWWENGAGDVVVEFLDATETAVSTPRMSLPGLVTNLQRLYREVEDFDYLNCAKTPRDHVLSGMRAIVDALQSFSSDADALVSFYFDTAEEEFKNAANAFEDMGFYGYDIRLSVPSLLW